jgi:hypothetical protein
VELTRQYLAGELSLLLARVPVVATEPASVEAAVRLRHLAETVPISDLGGIVVRALALTNSLCWESLERGDVAAFAQQTEMGAELHEFGVCSRLLAGT